MKSHIVVVGHRGVTAAFLHFEAYPCIGYYLCTLVENSLRNFQSGMYCAQLRRVEEIVCVLLPRNLSAISLFDAGG